MSGLPQLSIVAAEAQLDLPDVSDRLLLDAWISHQDSDAFAALVRRYAGLVIGICRRQCRSAEDAEDAFQATFLALSRDAKRLRRAECLAGWLHQVAYRTASRTRVNSRTMEFLTEEPSDPRDSLTAIAHRHLLRTLDEELQRLPENYRSAVVLHYFEGHSYARTAELLDTTEPAVRGRLERARKRLHHRLVCRGVSLSMAVAALSNVDASESVASELVVQTVANASQGGTVDAQLESLLVSESSVMSFPAVFGIGCAATLAIAGLLAGQIGIGEPAGGKQEVILAAQVGQPQQQQKQQPALINMGGDEFGFPSTSVPDRRLPADDTAGARAQRKPIPWAMASPAIYEKIEQALTKTTSLAFEETPLTDVVQQLRDQHDLPILIDYRALEEIGLAPDLPIRLHLENVSLHAGLRLMLRELDLTYTIDDEHLQITTQETDEHSHQLLRVYWVESAGLQANEGSAEVIQTMIDPEAWKRSGGQSDITILGAPDENASGFAIRTTYLTHRKIEDFLASVRAGTTHPLTGNIGENRPPPTPKSADEMGAMGMDEMYGGMEMMMGEPTGGYEEEK